MSSSSYQDVLSSHPSKKVHVRMPGLQGTSLFARRVGGLEVPHASMVPSSELVQEGQELRPDQADQKPTVCWDGDENDFHTLGTPVSCSRRALAWC
jgi:hypothetical protein